MDNAHYVHRLLYSFRGNTLVDHAASQPEESAKAHPASRSSGTRRTTAARSEESPATPAERWRGRSRSARPFPQAWTHNGKTQEGKTGKRTQNGTRLMPDV